jgi:hypothetical protein
LAVTTSKIPEIQENTSWPVFTVQEPANNCAGLQKQTNKQTKNKHIKNTDKNKTKQKNKKKKNQP